MKRKTESMLDIALAVAIGITLAHFAIEWFTA